MIHKSSILRGEDEFARTDRIRMTLLCEQDYDTFFGGESVISKAVQKLGVLEEFRAEVWKEVNSDDTITLMIWDNESGAFVGYCQYKNLLSGEADLGIELEESYRGKGLGYEVCSCLIKMYFSRTNETSLFYRVYRSNEPSIHLIDKLGGVYVGEKRMAEKLGDYLKDDPKALEDLDVLIYRIDRPE